MAFLAFALAACTGTNSSRSTGGDPSVISQSEIQEAGTMSSAYTLVQRLRPQWLRKRGPSSVENQGDILVYVDGNRQGPPSTLRNLDVVDIESMEFLSDNEATMRYGSGHDNGVILVHLKSS
jgi:hypothetical protein